MTTATERTDVAVWAKLPPPPPELPLPYLSPDYRYGDRICAVCLVWVNDHWWHRILAGHRYRRRTTDERWYDAQVTKGRI